MVGVNRFHQHANNLKRNLVSYYTYDDNDTSGTTLFDVYGNYNATLVNTPTTSSGGIIKEGYFFDATFSEYLNLGDIPEMEDVSAISINTWFNSSTATGNAAFIAKYESPAPGSWELAKNATQVFWRTWNTSGTQNFLITSSVGLIDGNWHMLTATYNNGQKYLHFDGGAHNAGWTISASAAAGNIRNTGYDINIARRPFSGATIPYDGNLDETGLWSGRELSFDDVTTLWNGGLGYKFNNWT